MNIYEIEEYAKDHGSDSLEFLMKNADGRFFNGKFLDAFMGLILIPEVSDGFIRLDQLKTEFDQNYFMFYPLDGSI